MSGESDHSEPVPFDRSFWALLPTLWLTLSPRRLGARLLHDAKASRALCFALLTTMPLSALAGLIPFTHSVQFGAAFSTSVVEGADLRLDIARACGIGVLVFAGSAALLVACFTSLARAFFDSTLLGDDDAHRLEGTDDERIQGLALRGALYVSWLVPCSGVLGLFGMFAIWASPEANSFFGAFVVLAMLLPAVLLLLGLNTIANDTCRLTGARALLVATAAFVLMMTAQYLLVGDPPGSGMLAPILPDVASGAP